MQLNFLKNRTEMRETHGIILQYIKNNIQKYAKRNTVKNSSGFTLLEALIGLTVISIVGIPVYAVFSDTIIFTEKIKETNRRNRELIVLERKLRKAVSQIKIPFWINDIIINEGRDTLKVPWWNGEADSFLIIELEEGDLKIETPIEGTKLCGYEGFEFHILKSSQTACIGISLSIKKIKEDCLIFLCAFGSPGKEVFK